MLSLRNRLGVTAGLISALALVFALFAGSALAADSGSGADASAKKKKNRKGGKNAGLNGKQKRQVIQLSRREARRFSGVPGPVGPVGLPGATGPQGPKGDKGSKGDDGDDGKSVIVVNEAPAGCPGEEGVTYEVQGSGNQNEVCDGAEGTFDPNGFTQTGVYAIPNEAVGPSQLFEGESAELAPISFTIPLQSAPDFVFVEGTATGFGEDEAEGCDGVVGGVPQADEGTFCVYGFANEPVELIPSATVDSPQDPTKGIPEPEGGVSQVGTFGLQANCTSSPSGVCYAKGLWAVTG